MSPHKQERFIEAKFQIRTLFDANRGTNVLHFAIGLRSTEEFNSRKFKNTGWVRKAKFQKPKN